MSRARRVVGPDPGPQRRELVDRAQQVPAVADEGGGMFFARAKEKGDEPFLWRRGGPAAHELA